MYTKILSRKFELWPNNTPREKKNTTKQIFLSQYSGAPQFKTFGHNLRENFKINIEDFGIFFSRFGKDKCYLP